MGTVGLDVNMNDRGTWLRTFERLIPLTCFLNRPSASTRSEQCLCRIRCRDGRMTWGIFAPTNEDEEVNGVERLLNVEREAIAVRCQRIGTKQAVLSRFDLHLTSEGTDSSDDCWSATNSPWEKFEVVGCFMIQYLHHAKPAKQGYELLSLSHSCCWFSVVTMNVDTYKKLATSLISVPALEKTSLTTSCHS
jgi:hypothetical protein